ncbi:VanW family protein [Clostridium sp. HBUAS56010]|uniref:VanW family protein n=1 Tax=Clostridium sp. HBUAS56010 TaxID=2571127 RepID=UPI0011786141|nr:VanW family protein [Clostridium sp. HBUAS56010]
MSQVDNRQRSGGRTRSSQSGTKRSTSKTGRRTSQSYRSSGSYQQRHGKKRKRSSQYNITKILFGIILAVAAVICIMAVVKYIGGHKAKETQGNSSTAAETELKKDVKVDGLTITGMSKNEAREAIKNKYPWAMKITYHNEEYKVKNLLESRIDALLEEIYTKDPKENYTLDTEGMEEAVKAEADAAAKKWNVPAQNGSISGFDKAAGTFIYSGEKNGIAIDADQLAADISAQIKAKNFSASIAASGREVAPKISEAQAKEMYKVIGTYTTTTTSNSARNKNIELASGALNGLILKPGEEFSFNKATGERSPAKGYRPAGAYLNGELVEEPGGGVCQVSSTLYNAVVFAGLTTTERHAHSYEPAYVTPGEDAMVSFGGPDMRFVNNSSSAIAIRTSFASQKLKISIVGIPILEQGVTLSMTSKKTAELNAPAPVYEEDQSLQPGIEKIVKAEKKGSRWVTNLVTKKDGTVVSDEFFHNSTYRGKPATIKRNTSGVVVPASSEGESSHGSGESTVPHPNESPVSSTAAEPHSEKSVPETEASKSQPQTSAAEETTAPAENIVPPNPLNQ